MNLWEEYDEAAFWCAERGLRGVAGDPLPNLLSVAVHNLIQADLEEFQGRVAAHAYGLAMNKLNIPDD